MKIVIERGALVGALDAIRSVIKTRDTIPILQNVKIEAGPAGVRLTASDLDMWATTQAKARIETPGAITVEASRLYEVGRRSPDGADFEIDCADNAGRASVKAGRSRFQLGTLPPGDFPLMAEVMADAVLTIEAGALLRLLAVGGTFPSTDRQPLAATFLNTVDGKVRAGTTDGKRLIWAERAAPEGFVFDTGAVIPTRTVAAMTRLLANEAPIASVDVLLSAGRLTMDAPTTRLSSKLYDAQTFQHLARFVPKDERRKLIIDTDMFCDSLRRVLIVADDSGGMAGRVILDVGANTLALSAAGTIHGDAASEDIECEWGGEPVRFPLNGVLLLSILEHVKTESVVLHVPDDPNVAKGFFMPVTETKADSDFWSLMATRSA